MRRIIEEKPTLNELCHYGMPRRSGRYPFGSGKDPASNSPRGKIISDTEKKIRKDVDKFGGLEASERVSTYAYEDATKIMRAELGPDWKNASKEKKLPYADLEGELIDRYDKYGFNYAESKRKK